MPIVTITRRAHDALVAHGAKPRRGNTPAVNIELDDEVIAALEKFSPGTGDAVHDLSESILLVCSKLFGNA